MINWAKSRRNEVIHEEWRRKRFHLIGNPAALIWMVSTIPQASSCTITWQQTANIHVPLWINEASAPLCVWTIYLLPLEGQRLAVRVRFDAASIVRSCGVKDPHQALQRVLQSDIKIVTPPFRKCGHVWCPGTFSVASNALQFSYYISF